MRYKVTDQEVNNYYRDGYVVFRNILPASLIADLRRVTDRGRELVRSKSNNSQVQRFQPVCDFDVDQKPFHDYANLPELHEAIGKVLSPKHTYGDTRWLGVLIEPAENSYCTEWHRDARNLLDDEEWNRMLYNYELANQVNCPLWDDSCTWFVPGSHLRSDTEGECNAFEQFPPKRPNLADLGEEAREQACLKYCAQMPGAIQLHLNAGDFALYRPMGWHLGNYAPYKKRATLHDGVWLLESGLRWRERLKELQEERKKKVA